jgi:ABC-type lipoprotein release transport system permease subunit
VIASLKLLGHLIFLDKSSVRFVVGIILGLAFSMTTILGTIGIMDAFVFNLRSALKDSSGDVLIQSRYGFFHFDKALQDKLKMETINSYTKVIKSQGFLINEGNSKGVMIFGIDLESYNQVTGQNIKISKDEMAIGYELSERMEAKIGDYLVLGLASGNNEMKDLPQLKRIKIGQIIKHTIFQKDSRMLYVDSSLLSEMIKLEKNKYNSVMVQVKRSDDTEDVIDDVVIRLRNEVGYDFVVRPYWQEYGAFVKAIKAEKIMIGLILQLIVAISVVNILAFIIFLNEKRSREIFLFKALGMGQRKFASIWLCMVTLLWAAACVVALMMVYLLKLFLDHFTYFEKLREIYNLSNLSLLIGPFEYTLVFGLALLWVLLTAWWGLSRMKRKSLLEGLRKEFA